MKVPETSRFCRDDKHEDCSHWYGMGSDYVQLCQCSCHADCPVRGGRAQIRLLRDHCTCAGARAWRAREEEIRPRLEEQRRAGEERSERAQAALRSLRQRPGATESEIRDDLARAYKEHGIEPMPGEIELAAGAIRSRTAAKGLHESLRDVSRHLGEAVRSLRGDGDQEEGSGVHDNAHNEPGE